MRPYYPVLPRPFIRVRLMSTSAPEAKIPRLPRLPRLPVPPLRTTLDKYLKSIQPFLLEDEARGGAPFEESFTLRVKWAKEFEWGVGREAQNGLVGQLFIQFFFNALFLSFSICWNIKIKINSNVEITKLT